MFITWEMYFMLELVAQVTGQTAKKSYFELKTCDNGAIANEIASYRPVVSDIINYVTTGPFKGKTYHELTKFIDTFGPRPSGTKVLEESIDYMIKLARTEELNDITTEQVKVPHWTRGQEKITMLKPRVQDIAVLGLLKSVSTPPTGITGEVVVFSSFGELENATQDKVVGKIVLFNSKYTTYFENIPFRFHGATKAAAKGAVASLVRSVAPFSINIPHTGFQAYHKSVKKIPTAAITLEDADFITRLVERGITVKLNITMLSKLDIKTSRNTIIDLKGTKDPNKLVIISGHIDSVDVGQGALDDGGGLFISWAAPVILKRLKLVPNRTIRSIFWTAEEFAYVGAYAYEKRHRNESHNINFIMESDEGTFAPLGLEVAGSQKTRCIIGEILKLFDSINATELVEHDSPGTDISVIIKNGIPGAGLLNANEKYFWFHHTAGDTMSIQNKDELDLCAAFWAAVAYVIADISVDIPRKICNIRNIALNECME